MGQELLADADLRERYLGLLRVGIPKHRAARELGLSNSVVARYTSKNQDFAEAVKDAVGEGVDPIYEKAYELALGIPCNCGQGQVQIDVGKAGNRGTVIAVHSPACKYTPPDPSMVQFMLKSLQPELFGAKLTVEHEHKIELGSATKLLELEQQLLRRQQELAGGPAILLPAEAIRELDS